MEYLYDNTFDGLLTCFYEHVYTEKADDILALRKDVQMSFGRQRQVQVHLLLSENKPEVGLLGNAADKMEEAFNQCPSLRSKYADQVRLWRMGIAM